MDVNHRLSALKSKIAIQTLECICTTGIWTDADPIYFKPPIPFGLSTQCQFSFEMAELKQQPAAPLLKEVELYRTAPTSNRTEDKQISAFVHQLCLIFLRLTGASRTIERAPPLRIQELPTSRTRVPSNGYQHVILHQPISETG
jgi:hypothetical protein